MSTSSEPESIQVLDEISHGEIRTNSSVIAAADGTVSTMASDEPNDLKKPLHSGTTSAQEHTVETIDLTKNPEATSSETGKQQEEAPASAVNTEAGPVQDAVSRMARTLENIDIGIHQFATMFQAAFRDNLSAYKSDRGDGQSDASIPPPDQPLIAELAERNQEARKGLDWREMPLITEIKKCNYRQFKEHRRSQPKHVLDVLLGDSTIQDEITAWNARFQTIDQPGLVPEPDDNVGEGEQSQKKDTERKWIHRIRINSSFVSKQLHDIGKIEAGVSSMLEDGEHIFLRPFAFLLHFHQPMQVRLRSLSDKHDKAAESTIKEPSASPDSDSQSLAELRCYVEFVEEYLMPDFNRYRDLTQPVDENEKIRFEDIWYLFQPGQLISIQKTETTEASPSRSNSVFQNIARVYGISHPTHRAEMGNSHFLEDDGYDCDECRWSIHCYNIDFDGEKFGWMTRVFPLKTWAGEKKIMDLECVPLSFLQDHEMALRRAVTDGKALVSLHSQRFGFYSGWTLTNGAFGEPLLDVERKTVTNSAHIESDVLVDYHETFNTYPWWKPRFGGPAIDTKGSGMRYLPTAQSSIEWNDSEGTVKPFEVADKIVISDCATFIQHVRYRTQDPFLISPRLALLTEEDHSILLRMFFAYSVWERKFVQLDVRFLDRREQHENDKAFESLQIDGNHKRLIKSLVQSHFRKKEAERKVKVEMETQDIIRGKGKGVIILLHGAPGVGKTATAEAIAQKWNKPLFPITCGDLGVDAETVEGSLNGIFRLAHLWDCILLLDEADVFITQRERRDLHRNALVSGEFDS